MCFLQWTGGTLHGEWSCQAVVCGAALLRRSMPVSMSKPRAACRCPWDAPLVNCCIGWSSTAPIALLHHETIVVVFAASSCAGLVRSIGESLVLWINLCLLPAATWRDGQRAISTDAVDCTHWWIAFKVSTVMQSSFVFAPLWRTAHCAWSLMIFHLLPRNKHAAFITS